MSSKSNANPVRTSGGFGLGWVFFGIFLTLKLGGAITWSWWWVTAPLWLPMLVALVLLGIMAIIAFGGEADK